LFETFGFKNNFLLSICNIPWRKRIDVTIDIGMISKDELKEYIMNTSPDFILIINFDKFDILGWIIGGKRGKSVVDMKFSLKRQTFIDTDTPDIKNEDPFKKARGESRIIKNMLKQNMKSFLDSFTKDPPQLIIGRECEPAPIRSKRKSIKKVKRK
jgi:hypothetical protein